MLTVLYSTTDSSSMSSSKPRPILVTILGLLHILLGALAFIGGLLALVGSSIEGLDVGGILASAGLITGLISLLIGIGFMKGWNIIWYIGVIFAVISALLSLVTILGSPLSGLFSLLIEAIILWYLFRPKVKGFFLD